jgi:predicted nucleic acid-binding protein
MRVVCDTGPVFHLIEASLLDLLLKAGEIHIPSTVDSELTDLLRQSWKKQKPPWITIDPLTPEENENVESLTLSGLLDPGEAGAILLAKRLKADWFLTDDTAARLFAGSMGLEVHGYAGCRPLGRSGRAPRLRSIGKSARTDQSNVTLDIAGHHDGSAQSVGQDVRIKQAGLLLRTGTNWNRSIRVMSPEDIGG